MDITPQQTVIVTKSKLSKTKKILIPIETTIKDRMNSINNKKISSFILLLNY